MTLTLAFDIDTSAIPIPRLHPQRHIRWQLGALPKVPRRAAAFAPLINGCEVHYLWIAYINRDCSSHEAGSHLGLLTSPQCLDVAGKSTIVCWYADSHSALCPEIPRLGPWLIVRRFPSTKTGRRQQFAACHTTTPVPSTSIAWDGS
ncbi:hypothetical protein Cob_v011611 [Colletotrichum orbiculare MAFF 240422]|uniref:Uncharacterized protein n=1 Tax=Colletotrichum orbiculare (strain 104-T / ATCC 96160 / CBS 514.97 / LARS 414 / MAFF 240422) TaxID=1213857 RepID=A0A484FC22_COLOR|nr:hypothetical protein Cob_v011611 [Colletotrichum orbiculare MAFF 240422]